MGDDGSAGRAIHDLLHELGWTHGEITPALIYQALAQVRHLRKMAAERDQLRAVCLEACDIALKSEHYRMDNEQRIKQLRKLAEGR